MKSITFLLRKINKISLISNDDKRMESIDLVEAYAYEKSLACKKEEINVIQKYLVLIKLQNYLKERYPN